MTHPTIASVARALPPHYHPQLELSRALQDLWAKDRTTLNRTRIEALHTSVQVRGRHLAIPMADYAALDTFEKRNTVWIREAQRLGGIAVRDAVAKAGLELRDIDVLCFTSITGLATPSIDARLMNELGLRSDVKRVPIFGLGFAALALGEPLSPWHGLGLAGVVAGSVLALQRPPQQFVAAILEQDLGGVTAIADLAPPIKR